MAKHNLLNESCNTTPFLSLVYFIMQNYPVTREIGEAEWLDPLLYLLSTSNQIILSVSYFFFFFFSCLFLILRNISISCTSQPSYTSKNLEEHLQDEPTNSLTLRPIRKLNIIGVTLSPVSLQNELIFTKTILIQNTK